MANVPKNLALSELRFTDRERAIKAVPKRGFVRLAGLPRGA